MMRDSCDNHKGKIPIEQSLQKTPVLEQWLIEMSRSVKKFTIGKNFYFSDH